MNIYHDDIISSCFLENNTLLITENQCMLSSLSHNISNAYAGLNKIHAFENVALGFTENEEEIFHSLILNTTKAYNNKAQLAQFVPEMTEFFISLGNQDHNALKAALIIKEVVQNIIDGSLKETAWVSVRAFTPMDEYDVPRWHQDGYYFSLGENTQQYKIALTFKGPSTLFNNCSVEEKEAFAKVQQSHKEDPVNTRMTLNALVSEKNIIKFPLYSATIFVVGSDHAAIHSEPPIHTERLFVSVLPGTYGEIQEFVDIQSAFKTTS